MIACLEYFFQSSVPWSRKGSTFFRLKRWPNLKGCVFADSGRPLLYLTVKTVKIEKYMNEWFFERWLTCDHVRVKFHQLKVSIEVTHQTKTFISVNAGVISHSLNAFSTHWLPIEFILRLLTGFSTHWLQSSRVDSFCLITLYSWWWSR